MAKNLKRGLTFASNSPNDISKANDTSSVISWQYNWGTSPPAYLASSGIPYVPMQWGAGDIANLSGAVKAQNAKIVLAFNEPDLSSQSNLSPSDASNLWQQYIQPLRSSGIRLGAPAVTNAPSGRSWLAEFLGQCPACQPDFIALHWYGEGIGAFYDYIWSMHGQFPNYPIWITEFASTSSDDAVVRDFLDQAIRYLDTLDFIERYAWFGFFRKESGSHYNLLDERGELNDLGHIYLYN
uniref:Asl1-like glycosyl hydrolase catalytic domain-containing protein n=1 Tax=Moniliophthora roreri TaxID=221103 RepID=A0A0W0FUM6_MONRR